MFKSINVNGNLFVNVPATLPSLLLIGLSEQNARSKLVEYKLEQARLSVIDNRNNAYKIESDPLYMEWQYDGTAEAEQKWRDKVAEIKQRYPLPTE